MEDLSKNSKYIKCGKCKCKYINGEEHINNDFGYTRLEMIYKTCVSVGQTVSLRIKLIMKTIKKKGNNTEKIMLIS